MKREDYYKMRIELAGLKGHAGIETLAAISTFSRNRKWQNLFEKIVEQRASLAQDPHPFPSPDELRVGIIHLGTALMMNGIRFSSVLDAFLMASRAAVALSLSRVAFSFASFIFC